MNDSEKRAHDIALFSSIAKILALINESNHTGKQLYFSFYEMYKIAYDEALAKVQSDYDD